MQQTCRICFEEGQSLLTPCRCRGTSAHIHPACLDQYIQYYPDRICRVCHTKFASFKTSRDIYSAVGILVVFTCLLFFSNARLLMKLALLGTAFLVTAYFYVRELFSPTPLVFLSILVLLFLPHSHPAAVMTWLILFAALAFLYTISIYIPAIFILGIVVTLILLTYVAFITFFAFHSLDTFAFTVYLGVLYLFWYGWVHDSPLPRYRLA